MKIVLVVHKQLYAREIYGENIVWKELYASFNDEAEQHGIYFYTYGDSKLPYYIGKSFAKSYKIVGRVWDELNDYNNGRYWLCKNPDLLKTLECFKKDYIVKNEGNFFKPKTDPKDPEFTQAIDNLLDNSIISFAYLKDEDNNPITESIIEVETQLQENLVKKYKLGSGWIGDGGKHLSQGINENHDLSIEYSVNPIRVGICNSIL